MGISAILQLDTPWTEDQIADLGYEQAADVMVFTHLDHQPQKLIRYAHDRWTLEPAVYTATAYPPTNASFTVTGFAPNTGVGYVATLYTYVVTTLDLVTGQESLPTVAKDSTATDLTLKGNSVVLGWGAVAGAERYNVYRRGGGAFGYIGTTDTLGFVDDNIAPDFSQSYPNARDPFAGAQDKPATVAFWQQRATYGRTYTKPNGIFASQSGNLFNFNVARPLIASDAAAFAVSGRRVNAVLHLVPLKSLIVFTTDMVFSIGKDFGPTQIDITPEGYRAASRVRPVVIDDIVMFNTAKGSSIRTLGYQFQADGYKGNDLTVFAPHFFRGVTVVDMNWAEYPHSVLNVVGSDGDIRALTWQAEQDVWGWSKLHTDGVVESVCTVSEGGEDVTYYIVRRTIGETQKRYVEYSASRHLESDAVGIFLDSARTYLGEPAMVFTGMQHLEGRTVTVVADGAVMMHFAAVFRGEITLPHAASRVAIGLSYESWIKTLPPVPETRAGSTKGDPATIAGVHVNVLHSRGLEIGQGKNLPGDQSDPVTSDDEIEGDIFEAKTRDGEPMGDPTSLYSGALWMDLNAGDWKDASVVVRQRYPLPMHIVGIAPDIALGG